MSQRYTSIERIAAGTPELDSAQYFFSVVRPNSEALRYIDLRVQGLCRREIAKAMNITPYRADLLRMSICNHGHHQPKALQRDRKILKTTCLRILIKSQFVSRRLKLFLESQGIDCIGRHSKNVGIVVTDDLNAALASNFPVVFMAQSFDSLPAIPNLVGCVSLPFSFHGVAAYLKAVIKRVSTDCIVLKDFSINRFTRTVSHHAIGQINLTATEFDILECLATNKGTIVSLEDIEAFAGKAIPLLSFRQHVCSLRKAGVSVKTYHNKRVAISG